MRDISYKLVGAFVLGAIALSVGMIIFVGGGNYFAERHRFIAFFEGSISGLRIGAPVAINGVPVGSVYDIKVEIDGKDGKIVNPVFIELEREKIKDINFNGDLSLGAAIARLIAKGLRAQLRPQSIVTGLLYIELSFVPRVRATFRDNTYGLPEIPSAPSPLQELKETIDNLKVQDIFLRLESVLVGIDKYINSPELNQTTVDFREAVSSIKIAATEAANLTTKLNQGVENNEEQLLKALQKVAYVADSLHVLITRATNVVESVGKGVGEDSKFRFELTEAMKEVKSSARSLRELSEYLKRNPNALVTGKRS